MAATHWTSNAQLIEDVARLGYLTVDDLVLDPTYGKGIWWKNWRPTNLVTRSNLSEPSFDFRSTDYDDNTFDAITYDPPYVSVGGRKTSGIVGMYDGYGLIDAPTSPSELQQLINDGLTEMLRIVKPGGIILTKCQDYVSSGKLWIGTHHTVTHALNIGCELVDRLEHVTNPRPQPSGRRQVHARRNLSTMLVFRAPTRKARQ
jgi:DNA modification methylase